MWVEPTEGAYGLGLIGFRVRCPGFILVAVKGYVSRCRGVWDLRLLCCGVC